MSILLPNFCLYRATIGVLIVNTLVEEEPWIRDRPRFFDQVGHQTNASIGISIFSLNIVLVRLTKIMNNLAKDFKILSFKVIFKCLKLVESFQKKISVKNITKNMPNFCPLSS